MIEDRLAEFIGKVARPSAIIVTASAAAWATIIIAHKVTDGDDGFLFIGGVFTGVAALYIGRAVESFRKDRNAADVAIAQAGQTAAVNAAAPAEPPAP